MEEKIKKNKELLKEQSIIAEKKAKETFEDYKKFAIKGNVVDLAIGVVIGSAFTSIINAIVSNFVTPLLSIITAKVDINDLFISLSGGKYATLEEAKNAGAVIINYGALITSILNFFIVTVILYVFFRYISKIRTSSEKGAEEEIKHTTKECPYCKSTINIHATKCAFCTSEVELVPEVINEVNPIEIKKIKNKKS